MSVRLEKSERVISITLDHPPLNIMDISLLRELDAVLSTCASDPAADLVVLRGAGERAFSAGVDIKDHSREKVPEMLEVVRLLEEAIGKKAKRELVPMQPGDVPATYANVDDLIRDVGFRPSTPIAEGIARFVAWFRVYHRQ